MRFLRFIFVISMVWATSALGDLPRRLELPNSCTQLMFQAAEGYQIFSARERAELLAAAGIEVETLPQLFDELKLPHLMIARAKEALIEEGNLTADQKAAFWEEMTSHIDRKVNGRVSIGAKVRAGDQSVYVFQGTKKFGPNDFVHVLLIFSDDSAQTSVRPVEPIFSSRMEWNIPYEELTALRK